MATGKTNAVVGSGSSTDLSVVTATASDVLKGKKFVNSSGTTVTGTITKKAAATYTPTTSDQTIASGQYLNGTQTIEGDSNLKAANIRSGKTIFGVAGSYAPVSIQTATGTFTGGGSTSATITGLSGYISMTPTIKMWKVSTSNSDNTANQLQLAVGDASDGVASGRGTAYQSYNFYSSDSVSVSKSSTSIYLSTSTLKFTSGVTYSYKIVFTDE